MYTYFQRPEEAAKSRESMAGQFEGIGAYIEWKDGQLRIISPIEASPAEKSGILAGDVVLKVDGTELARLIVCQHWPTAESHSTSHGHVTAATPLRPPSSNVDVSFACQLASIVFRVAIPSWYSKEALILLAHSFFLVMRTVLSVAVARLDGRIVRDLVSADKKGFLKGLGLWFALAVPSIYTNSMVSRPVNPHIASSLTLL